MTLYDHSGHLSLDRQPAGSACTIHRIKADTRSLERFLSMGLTLNTHIHVICNRKRQPILVYASDTAIALAPGEAQKIIVKQGD